MKFVVYKTDIELRSLEKDVSEFEVLVGRSAICDLTLEDHRVSREHILLSYSNDILSLKDVSGSGNVKVNGSNVTQAIISENDVLTFFDYVIRVSGFAQAVSSHSVELEQTIKQDAPQQDEAILLNQETEILGSNSDDIKLSEGSEELGLDQDSDELTFSDMDDSFDSNSFNELDNDLVEVVSEDSYDSDNTAVITDFLNYSLIISGPDIANQKYAIDKNIIYIGRSKKKCHIVLEDDEISSVHAKIEVKGKNIVIEDMKSQNGIYLNGDKVNKANLVKGDEILIGNVSFVLNLESKFVEDELKRLMPINDQEIDYQEETLGGYDDVAVFSEEGENAEKKSKSLFGKLFSKNGGSNSEQKRKYLIYTVVVFGLAWVVLDDESEGPASQAVVKTETVLESADREVANINKEEPLELETTFTEDEIEYLNDHYHLAKTAFEEGDYAQSLYELDLVQSIDKDFKQTQQLVLASQEGLENLEELEKKRIETEERLERSKKVAVHIEKAQSALKSRNLELVETYLSKVYEIDPENIEVVSIKKEVELIKNAIESEKQKKETKRLAKEKFLLKLKETDNFLEQNELYKAYKKTDEYRSIANVDEVLTLKGEELRKEIFEKMTGQEESYLSKARAFKNGEDFKNAFESYQEVLKVNPTNVEAINESNSIKILIKSKAMNVYREGLISESISLHRDAKEKFEEVLQIAPIGSYYYSKAKERLIKFYNIE